MRFKIRPTTLFVKVAEAYAARVAQSLSSLMFFHEERKLMTDPMETIADAGIHDGDQIDVIVAQVGC